MTKSTQLTNRLVRSRVGLAAFAGAAALALTLAGCTAGGGSSSGGKADSSGAKGGEGITIAVMGGATSDSFWSTVKNGGLAAAAGIEKAGGEVKFIAMPNYNNFNPDAAKLVSNILAMKPDAAVIPDWAPEAQNGNIKALTDAGVAVFLYNNGSDQVEKVGAKGYIGSDNTASGKAAGEGLAKAGSKHPICINTLPGTVTGEQYCDGLKQGAEKGGAAAEVLSLPSSQFGDPSAVTQAIKGALLKDPSIDGVFTVNTQDATSAVGAIKQAGLEGKVHVAGQNFDAAALKRIADGTQTLAIDQQGFAQGYYAVSAAYQYVAYGIEMPDQATGPTVIDKSNLELVQKGVKLGVR
jgi:simple sugar transport system substrate-binding protein